MKLPLITAFLLCAFFETNHAKAQCPDTLNLVRQSQVDSFRILYPNCISLKEVNIDGDDITNISALLGVKKVWGTILIRYNPLLISLHGLDSLTSVGKRFHISQNNSLNSLHGLESLSKVEDGLYIERNPLLADMRGLDALYHIQTLWIQSNDNLRSLEGLEHLAEGGIPFSLLISTNPRLQNLKALENLTRVWGISITRNDSLINLDELENLTSLNYIRVEKNKNLTSIKGFRNVEFSFTIDINIVIKENPKLISLEGLEKIIIAATITISGNPLLADLKGLDGIRYIENNYDGLTITHNSNLQSLNGLDSLAFVNGAIHISHNPLLTKCAIYIICERINFPDSTVLFMNGLGCSSHAEVFTACGYDNGYITGKVYLDMNCDMLFDTGDYIVDYHILESVETNMPLSATSAEGIYIRYFREYDTIHLQPRAIPLFTSDPASYSISTDSTFQIHYDKDFAFCPDTLFHELAVNLILPNWPRPGFPNAYEVCVENKGLYPENVILTFDFSNAPEADYVTIDSASGNGVISGTSVTWHINKLIPFSSECFTVDVTMAANTPISTLLRPHAWVESVTPIIEDIKNNEVTLLQEVRASIDPNDKTVDKNRMRYGQAEELTYTIRFQNTGNFPATFIEVLDTMPAGLNMATFEMIEASHAFTLSFPDANIVKWRFDNIQLPDSTSNEVESHGFIHFKIKAFSDLLPETMINNTASIYFDFNEPVVTNAAHTLVEVQTKTNNLPAIVNEISIFPNPTSGKFQIEVDEAEINPVLIEILDLNGRVILRLDKTDLIEGRMLEVYMNPVQPGVYLIRLLSNDDIYTGRIILVRE